MSMVNDAKTEPKVKSDGFDWALALRLVGNILAVCGQVLWLGFSFVVICFGAVAAGLIGFSRGAKNHHTRR